MTHNELANSLASHLVNDKRMVWEDIPTGAAGSIRPDVFTIEKSFAHPNPVSYEVKVSRSDFLNDVTSGKWRGYLDFSDGVVFAVPKGLITKQELPDKAGLIVYSEGIWRTVKRPILSERSNLNNELLLKLLIGNNERQTKQEAIYPRSAIFWHEQARLRKAFGDEVAGILKIRDSIEEKNSLLAIRKEICEILGLPMDEPVYRIRNALYYVKQNALKANAQIVEAVDAELDSVIRSMEHAKLALKRKYKTEKL